MSLPNNKFIILDGGMGTMLQSLGIDIGENPELLGITNPDAIIGIHKSYIDAGANIIYANTFGINAAKLQGSGYTVSDVVSAAIANAKKACEGTDMLVALDIGSLGEMLEPSGTITFEAAYDLFKEKIIAGADADLIVIETMADLSEIKIALSAAKENSDLPVICTMSFDKSMRTYTGCCIPSMALTLQTFGADAIGVNCSVGPADLLPMIEELSKWTTLPVVVKPNAGLPCGDNMYDMTADEFSAAVEKLLPFGVKFIGGCCGTTPEYIKKTVKMLAGYDSSNNKSEVCLPVNFATSPTKTVVITDEMVIHKPKKIKLSDIDSLIDDAFEQIDNGVDVVSVDISAAPSVEITTAIKQLQAVINVPLAVCYSSDDELKAAQRVYAGVLYAIQQ